MKSLAFLKRLMLLLLVAIMTFSMFACDKPGDESTSEDASDSIESEESSEESSEEPSYSNVVITLDIDKEEIRVGGETAFLTVEVTGTDNPAYELTFSEEGIIAVNDGVISIVNEEFTLAKSITITATADADKHKTASKAIVVRPAKVEGQVGELTSAMIDHIGNKSITVTGVLTDEYTDFNQPLYSGTTQYDMSVTMEEGRWSGSWNRHSAGLADDPIVITDIYCASEEDGYMDAYNNYGHAMQRILINKNNQVEKRTVKDYMSVPAVWEAQHLYNHLGDLNVNKFEYDPVNEVYEYVYDKSNMDDLYLMTYLSYSLTPLLEETLDKLYFVVENGAVTKIIAETPVVYYGEYYDQNNQVHRDAMSVSRVELTLSDVGTTVVADPKPFTAGQYNDVLAAAITEMAAARNYTFDATETTTQAPSGDAGDYEIMSVDSAVGNTVSSTGKAGLLGQVTEDAILLGNTIKYSYSMDGKDYATTYTGYKNNGDGTYDHFEYDSKLPGFRGTKRVQGSVADVLPTFDFAPEIFVYDSQFSKNGKNYYVFSLRETAINRDVALEVSMHSYAEDAAADASQKFTITVSEDGHLYQTTYCYDLVSGTYLGIIETTYGKVGTTELPENVFDNYVPRKVMDSWDDYNVMYFSSTPTGAREEVTADVALEVLFGEAAADVPALSIFIDIFGDNLNGPFWDWNEHGADADGNIIYRGELTFNTSATEFDENAKITNLEEVFGKIEEELIKVGFTKSVANCGGYGTYEFICFIKGDVQIYIENNGTKHIWIHFCKAGDWTLKK